MTEPRARLGALLVAAAAVPLLLSSTAGLAEALTPAHTTDDALVGTHDIVVDGAAPPKIYARSWVVVDADTGDVLAAKNAHLRLRPASTLKTLTAVTLLPRLDLDDQYRVQWRDAHITGSAVGIVPGSRYTIDDLFYGLMLPSGNDAARALASANGGLAATVRQMNAVAASLGAFDTQAVNPTGLDAPGQHSSSFDLALFAREGLLDKDFRRYVSTTSTSFPAEEPKRDTKRDSFMIYNQNPLLIDGYRGILGVKTGYTTEAGRTFVAAAERGDQRLIVALMGIVESSETAATKLFEWGWNHGTSVTPVGSLDAPHLPVVAEPTPSATSAASPSPATPSTAATTGVQPSGAVALSPSAAAAPVDESLPGDSQAVGAGARLLPWVIAGVVLIIAGLWLQGRRRPTEHPPQPAADHGPDPRRPE